MVNLWKCALHRPLADGLTLRLIPPRRPGFHVDDFDAAILAAFRADMMRLHGRFARGANRQRSGLERQMAAPAIARPFGQFSFWKWCHVTECSSWQNAAVL
jgi:hypothetical protein